MVYYSLYFITFAGMPTETELSGKVPFTKPIVPTTAQFPIFALSLSLTHDHKATENS